MKIKLLPLCFAVSFAITGIAGAQAQTKELHFSWWGATSATRQRSPPLPRLKKRTRTSR